MIVFRMSVFMLLSVPLFLLFYRALVLGGKTAKGRVWAFVLGFIAALIGAAIGPLVPFNAFGFGDFLRLFVDLVAVPVLASWLGWALLAHFRGASFTCEPTDFMLTWLIGPALFYALSNGSAPLAYLAATIAPLWIALAVGLPFLFQAFREEFGIVSISSLAAAILLPFAATASVWAFRRHNLLLGFLFFAASAAPAVFSLIIRSRRR